MKPPFRSIRNLLRSRLRSASSTSIGDTSCPTPTQKRGPHSSVEAATETESLTELEKLEILAHHAQFVEMNLERAAEYSKAVLSIYPDRPWPTTTSRSSMSAWGALTTRLPSTSLLLKPIRIGSSPTTASCGCSERGPVMLHQIVEWANREIEITDDQPWPYTNLSWAYIGLGECERAVTAARRAIDIDPENLRSHYHLGHALTCEGEYEGAARAFEKVLELGPTQACACPPIRGMSSKRSARPTLRALTSTLSNRVLSK